MADPGLADAFMGSVTVGERGQVVIPVEARERLDLKAGDKLLALMSPNGWGISFVKIECLQVAQRDMEQVLAWAEGASSIHPDHEEAGREAR